MLERIRIDMGAVGVVQCGIVVVGAGAFRVCGCRYVGWGMGGITSKY